MQSQLSIRRAEVIVNICDFCCTLAHDTHNLKLKGNDPKVEDLHCGPQHVIGLQRRYVYVFEFSNHGTPTAALSHRHESEEACQACACISDVNRSGRVAGVPIGANISWSNATIFKAGTVPLCFVIGKDLDKKANQWNCKGDIMNPYAMNRVNLSKSKGGGKYRDEGNSSFAGYGLFSSKSGISMETRSSLPGSLLAFDRIAVNDWATVSAIPPRTCITPPSATRYVCDSLDRWHGNRGGIQHW